MDQLEAQDNIEASSSKVCPSCAWLPVCHCLTCSSDDTPLLKFVMIGCLFPGLLLSTEARIMVPIGAEV